MPSQDILKKVIAGFFGVIIFLFTLSVVLATLLYKFIMGGDVVIPQYAQSTSTVIMQTTATPSLENTRKILQFKGTIKSDPEYAKEADLPGPWFWLYFDEPYLLEVNSAAIPMYVDKLAIYPINKKINIKKESLEMYTDQHVAVAGYLGWGYAESRIIEPTSITTLP